jgi:fatty acid desaturase
VLLPLMLTFSNCYGAWLFWLCNNTQHVGLQDNVADFRLNCRTFLLNPLPRFLYWQMNYHIEHHMYPTVPCYRLKQLRKTIQHDLPPASVGLVQVWQEITAILQKQQADPTYQHHAAIPAAEGVTAG